MKLQTIPYLVHGGRPVQMQYHRDSETSVLWFLGDGLNLQVVEHQYKFLDVFHFLTDSPVVSEI